MAEFTEDMKEFLESLMAGFEEPEENEEEEED
jgi:hypothetical protein